jgi:hypothetical protein
MIKDCISSRKNCSSQGATNNTREEQRQNAAARIPGREPGIGASLECGRELPEAPAGRNGTGFDKPERSRDSGLDGFEFCTEGVRLS